MTHSWSHCFTKAEQAFKAADRLLLEGNRTAGVEWLVKAQQWMAEASKSLLTEEGL